MGPPGAHRGQVGVGPLRPVILVSKLNFKHPICEAWGKGVPPSPWILMRLLFRKLFNEEIPISGYGTAFNWKVLCKPKISLLQVGILHHHCYFHCTAPMIAIKVVQCSVKLILSAGWVDSLCLLLGLGSFSRERLLERLELMLLKTQSFY